MAYFYNQISNIFNIIEFVFFDNLHNILKSL